MTTYNHAYSLAFSVAGSSYRDPDEAMRKEVDKVIEALLKRVAELVSDNSEYLEALEGWDTFEED